MSSDGVSRLSRSSQSQVASSHAQGLVPDGLQSLKIIFARTRAPEPKFRLLDVVVVGMGLGGPGGLGDATCKERQRKLYMLGRAETNVDPKAGRAALQDCLLGSGGSRCSALFTAVCMSP